MSPHRTTPSLCPHCGKLLDGVTCLEDDAITPKPGDFSVCFGCSALLTFDETLIVRLATDQELKEFSNVAFEDFAKMIEAAIGAAMIRKINPEYFKPDEQKPY
jgi:hypothetical protein